MKKLLLPALIALTSCSSLPDWMGAGDDKPALQGERISVIDSGIYLSPDASLLADVISPETAAIAFNKNQKLQIGEAAPDKHTISNPPIFGAGLIFLADGKGNIFALNQADLSQKWVYNSNEDSEYPSGGIAYANGIVYATQGNGEVIALTAENGTEIWKKNLGAPIRKTPAIGDDKAFVATVDNQLFALNLVDGATIWRHSGSSESTINYGSPTPAVKDGVVVIAYSSGEVFALNSARGSELWAETISTGTERRKTASTFVDVSAAPVIADSICYIGSQNGSVIAFNLGNGYRVWEQKIGTVEHTPQIIGNYVFAIADNNKIIALNRFDGRVKWVANLPADESDSIIKWAGPVIAGGNVIASSTSGKIAVFDVNNGQLTSLKDGLEAAFAAPVANNGSLFLISKNAELAVF